MNRSVQDEQLREEVAVEIELLNSTIFAISRIKFLLPVDLNRVWKDGRRRELLADRSQPEFSVWAMSNISFQARKPVPWLSRICAQNES
jgi:hypothetical protein